MRSAGVANANDRSGDSAEKSFLAPRLASEYSLARQNRQQAAALRALLTGKALANSSCFLFCKARKEVHTRLE